MKKHLWLCGLVALWASGCAPDFAGDYLCGGAVGEMPCPPGWVCWEDDICRDHPPPYPELLQLCPTDDEEPGLSPNQNDNCSTRFCANGIDPMAEERGAFCTTVCDDDDDCEETGERGGICVSGACRPICQRGVDCPDETQCWYGIADPMGPPPRTGFCFTLSRMDLNGTRSCTSNQPGECELPGWCMQPVDGPGVCSMLCEITMGMPEQCPMGTACVQVMSDIGQCLSPCTGAADCPDAGLECVDFAGTGYCAPNSWAGADLTTGTFRMPPAPDM